MAQSVYSSGRSLYCIRHDQNSTLATSKSSLMPQSHQTFHPVLAVKLLGIMLRNRCWPTTFHTIATKHADGWCQNWPVWSTPHAPATPHCSSGSKCIIYGDHVENRCWPTTFHTITVGDADRSCWNWPVWSTPQPHQNSVPTLSKFRYPIDGRWGPDWE